MATPLSSTQLPLQDPGAPDEDFFGLGLAVGRGWTESLVARTRALARENPAAFLAIGVGAGFLVGRLLLRPRRAR